MIGTIFIYKLTTLDQIKRDEVCRKLLGRTVKTLHGKYNHHVEGLLDTIPHIRIGRGIIIVAKINKQKLSYFFRNWRVKNVFMRDIILAKTDIQRLAK